MDQKVTQVNMTQPAPSRDFRLRRPPQELQDPSLTARIRNAKFPEEVDALVRMGKSQFDHASPKTVKKWEGAAEARKKELAKAKEQEKVENKN